MVHKEATDATHVTFYDENNRPINNDSIFQQERPAGYEGSTGWIAWDTGHDRG